MPNANVHVPVAAISGVIFDLYQSQGLPLEQRLPQALGALVGSVVGGKAPDFLDPPMSPNHRNFAHGAMNVGGVIMVGAEYLFKVQQELRDKADAVFAARRLLTDEFDRTLSLLHENFLRFLIGVLNGFTAGYVSHLILDAGTPQGLPLFAAGI